MSLCLTNQLLIAMPGLVEQPFNEAAILICDHNSDGAFGVIVNRPLPLTYGEVFKQMELDTTSDIVTSEYGHRHVHFGGPVQQQRGVIVHPYEGDWESTFTISDSLAVTTSRDIVVELAQGKGPQKILFALGYAGWGPGQLEHELADNAWLAVPNDEAILFEVDVDRRWHAALMRAGINPARLTTQAGHA